jgi:hypothetical protein
LHYWYSIVTKGIFFTDILPVGEGKTRKHTTQKCIEIIPPPQGAPEVKYIGTTL